MLPPHPSRLLCRSYHQYKFIVDGEWRHDESQPFMPDPLGNVNNWLFVRKPEGQPAAHGCGGGLSGCWTGAAWKGSHGVPCACAAQSCGPLLASDVKPAWAYARLACLDEMVAMPRRSVLAALPA